VGGHHFSLRRANRHEQITRDSFPPNTTNQDLRSVFKGIGPVLHAKVVNDLKGNCIVGVVEMFCAEDVEEILTSK
jgi:RNA recognition motif-containing protein